MATQPPETDPLSPPPPPPAPPIDDDGSGNHVPTPPKKP